MMGWHQYQKDAGVTIYKEGKVFVNGAKVTAVRSAVVEHASASRIAPRRAGRSWLMATTLLATGLSNLSMEAAWAQTYV
jgi:hypothetical protein